MVEVKKGVRNAASDKVRMQETAEMVAWIKAGDQRAVIFYGK